MLFTCTYLNNSSSCCVILILAKELVDGRDEAIDVDAVDGDLLKLSRGILFFKRKEQGPVVQN